MTHNKKYTRTPTNPIINPFRNKYKIIQAHPFRNVEEWDRLHHQQQHQNESNEYIIGACELNSIFEKIFKLEHKCEMEKQKIKEMEEKAAVEFFNKDYDEIIEMEINTLDDLIYLGNLYRPENKKKYNINLKVMHSLVKPLEELNNMIGMQNVKNQITDLIIFHLQDLQHKNQNMLHTVIEGPPGCGKTECAKILGKIFLKMGSIKSDFFYSVKRSDLIGKYLGSTAIKTQEVINKVKEKGGVLFIDEAYSLGNEQQADHFSQECIDTLNQNLSENTCSFICIIAGYSDSLSSSFFAYNKGLERRFSFRFIIKSYNQEELRLIYLKMIEKEGWRFESDEAIDINLFKQNKDIFKNNGGDMETLFHFTKIVHARRVFFLPKDQKKNINKHDLENAIEMFTKNMSKEKSSVYHHLYI
jgi:SpoVK/Ycf46/Vps4 family AAA+-type ATPase